jgi:uncharacterized membrane protein YbhN (UPF0104 family)
MHSPPTGRNGGWRSFVARHLFAYLAVLAGLVVVVSAVFARDELALALDRFALPWLPAVLGLTLVNYALRFWKWTWLLGGAGVRIPTAANARLYYACLSMVVTPARLGELYKLVFLRKLHGVPAERSLPPLVLERITDALAVLALIAAQPFAPGAAVGAVALVVGAMIVVAAALGHRRPRDWTLGVLASVPGLRTRRERVGALLEGHADLLRPRIFGPSLVASALAWWAECLGLGLICRALGEPIAVVDATWVYATSTFLGNLTFLPGGLVGTEASLLALLHTLGVSEAGAVGATALVRGATLWFAVLLGLAVTLVFRRRLRWDEVTAEATSPDARGPR